MPWPLAGLNQSLHLCSLGENFMGRERETDVRESGRRGWWVKRVHLWHEPWKASVTGPHQSHSTPASHSTICPQSWQKRHRQPLDTVRGWENWCRLRRHHIPHTKLLQHRFTIYMEATTRFSSLRWAEYSFWERQIMSRLLSFYSLRAERQRGYR